MSQSRPSPPTSPLKNFETNASRVRALICEVQEAVPRTPRHLQSDVAAAAIVMTLASVDTYFGDRLAQDFERRFDLLDPKGLADILALMSRTEAGGLETTIARALQRAHPKTIIIDMFKHHVDQRTYQAPDVIKNEVERFGLRNPWGDARHLLKRKYGQDIDVEAGFKLWANRRHAIAHRAGRTRSPAGSRRQASSQQASREEARQCLIFFTRLIGVMDYRLNDVLYGRQPRKRQSEIAIFDLEPVTARRSFVPSRVRRGSRP